MISLCLFAIFGLAFGQPGSPSNLSSVVDLIKPIETTLAKLIDQAGLTDVLAQGGLWLCLAFLFEKIINFLLQIS